MSIEQNIAARESAEAALQFIESEWSDVPPRFWECLRDLCACKLPQVEQQVDETGGMDEMTA